MKTVKPLVSSVETLTEPPPNVFVNKDSMITKELPVTPVEKNVNLVLDPPIVTPVPIPPEMSQDVTVPKELGITTELVNNVENYVNLVLLLTLVTLV